MGAGRPSCATSRRPRPPRRGTQGSTTRPFRPGTCAGLNLTLQVGALEKTVVQWKLSKPPPTPLLDRATSDLAEKRAELARLEAERAGTTGTLQRDRDQALAQAAVERDAYPLIQRALMAEKLRAQDELVLAAQQAQLSRQTAPAAPPGAGAGGRHCPRPGDDRRAEPAGGRRPRRAAGADPEAGRAAAARPARPLGSRSCTTTRRPPRPTRPGNEAGRSLSIHRTGEKRMSRRNWPHCWPGAPGKADWKS